MDMKKMEVSAAELVPIICEVLAGGKAFCLTVTGASMTPTVIDRRDKVELVTPKNIRKNDIVFFKRKNGEYVLHRVIKIDGEKLLINGDAQSWTETIDASQVFATVNSICRNDRWFSADNNIYAAYVSLWRFTRPFRPYIFKIISLIKRILKKIWKELKGLFKS